jgi:hypothetical protein
MSEAAISPTVVLGANDYVRTVQSADGRKLVEFVRDQGDGTHMSVAVECQPGEQPRITVQARKNPPETLPNGSESCDISGLCVE